MKTLEQGSGNLDAERGDGLGIMPFGARGAQFQSSGHRLDALTLTRQQQPGAADSPKFVTGQFRSSLESVRSYLGGGQVYFYQGLFPATAEPVKNKVFSFVHVDVDLQESTLACLRFFYPRLSPGGILISHDYLTSEGVNAAFRVFFADKPEPVIELTGRKARDLAEEELRQSAPACGL